MTTIFKKLQLEREKYIAQQESLQKRYLQDAKANFQEMIDNLMEHFEDMLIEKVNNGRIGEYLILQVPEVSHPPEGIYSTEYNGYEAIDLFQLLHIESFEEKQYYLSKEIIKDEVLLEFWEVLVEEGLKPYFLVKDKGITKERTIELGVFLPE